MTGPVNEPRRRSALTRAAIYLGLARPVPEDEPGPPVCEVCGAVLTPGTRGRHREWHRRLGDDL